MVASRATLPDLDALDPHELKALIVAQHKQLATQEERIFTQNEQLASRDAEIEHLKLLIAKLRRMQFGCTSEKLDRQIEQLELRLVELEESRSKEALERETSAAESAVTRPAVWFCYSPDRKGEHPKEHLSSFSGTLQADGYAGFEQIYESGRIQEAACWAHLRRKFYDLQAAQSPLAVEAIERIAGLYAIESEIRGRSPEERREIRNLRADRCWTR